MRGQLFYFGMISLSKKLSYKSSPNILCMFGLFSNKCRFMEKLALATFWQLLETIWLLSVQHLITLVATFIPKIHVGSICYQVLCPNETVAKNNGNNFVVKEFCSFDRKKVVYFSSHVTLSIFLPRKGKAMELFR